MPGFVEASASLPQARAIGIAALLPPEGGSPLSRFRRALALAGVLTVMERQPPRSSE